MNYSAHKTALQNSPKPLRIYPFVSTGKERDEETGYGYFGARYMDHELMTMWLSVDPMADKYTSISPYAYCAWNPVKLVDPDGREINPVYGSDGTFRGNTKEGFTGEIVIYDGSIEFENLSVEQLYQQAAHQANVQPGAADALPYSVAAGSMTDEAKSKMYTDIVSRFEGDNILGTIFSMDDVKDGKIYFDASRSGNWATAYDENGNLGDGSKIYATDHYLTAYEPTVENIAASVICHEWFSHKIQGCSDATRNHQQAYVNVMNGPYWGGTTDAYKSFVQSKFTKYAGR